MERSAFYPDLGMSAIRPMKTPHFKLLLFTIVIITIIFNHRPHQVSNKKKTSPFLFKDDDDCGDFHSAAKTTEIWIVSSGKLFLSPFSPISLFWLPLASGNADTQQALENWPGDKNVVFLNLFKCALIPFFPLIAPFSRICLAIIKIFGLYFLFKTIKPPVRL